MATDEALAIPQFYGGKNVFITGGAGFIGKVLIEKLLRSCPKIGKVYVLLRSKKGLSAEERLKTMIALPIFDNIKENQPDALPEKLIVVQGDVSELGLGLSDTDRNTLIENVNIVFHCAASVRFDDPLQDAILINTRGCREICNLALDMKNICVFLHVSTTYCNCDRKVIEEKLYPPHADWQTLIEIAEKVDKYVLQVLSPKIIDKLPNTYTFSKSMSEHVVNDLLKDKIPAVILRPSIVISSMNEPLPGWVDNFNGPVALMVASAKGVIRTTYSNPDIKADFIPVDICVRGIIAVAWHHGLKRDASDIAIYNCSSHGHQPITMTEMIDMARKMLWEIPAHTVMWYPSGSITKYKMWYYINVIFLHLLPAIFVDTALTLLGQKPMLLKIQRRVYTANTTMAHFLLNQWTFLNHKIIEKEATCIPKNCKEEFGFDRLSVDYNQYFRTAMEGGRKYLLNDYSDYNVARKRLYRMYILHLVVKYLIWAGLFWLVFFKLDVVTTALDWYSTCKSKLNQH